MKHKVRHIHFVGIGGVGMSGIAEVLHNLGYYVTGSDATTSVNTTRLEQLDLQVSVGHDEKNVVGADVVVVSTAVKDDNPEIIAANKMAIPIVPRAMMLAELMRFKYGIAIAGTHGKTTTTSLCAEVFSQCNLDPTFIIGGKLAVTESNAKLGAGDYLIAEADESDASFLYLNPFIAVVTNIDHDHMDTYNHDENILKQTFIDFLHKLPFYGKAVLCNEDRLVREIAKQIKRPIITYGLSEDSDIYAKNIVADNEKMHYILCLKQANISHDITLNLPGIHNVLNSLAVIAVALECGGKIEDIAVGLANFHGVNRRCQRYPDLCINGKHAILIDDYGHHPAEIRATISALVQAYPKHRLVLIFQPHRYTRTRDLFDDFVQVLSSVSQLILLEVYPAMEKPIPLADSRSLIRAIRMQGDTNVVLAGDLLDAKKTLYKILQNADMVVTMGAGSISKLPQMLLDS
ncbi:MAG: UDP-N-acetylmuramate--L-alanine ligase [Bacteroidia bacterium]|nr:MAG: UDP-N-acetylmuramate--L-alanine ligase [Bacteroidia bacterium]